MSGLKSQLIILLPFMMINHDEFVFFMNQDKKIIYLVVVLLIIDNLGEIYSLL